MPVLKRVRPVPFRLAIVSEVEEGAVHDPVLRIDYGDVPLPEFYRVHASVELPERMDGQTEVEPRPVQLGLGTAFAVIYSVLADDNLSGELWCMLDDVALLGSAYALHAGEPLDRVDPDDTSISLGLFEWNGPGRFGARVLVPGELRTGKFEELFLDLSERGKTLKALMQWHGPMTVPGAHDHLRELMLFEQRLPHMPGNRWWWSELVGACFGLGMEAMHTRPPDPEEE